PRPGSTKIRTSAGARPGPPSLEGSLAGSDTRSLSPSVGTLLEPLVVSGPPHGDRGASLRPGRRPGDCLAQLEDRGAGHPGPQPGSSGLRGPAAVAGSQD